MSEVRWPVDLPEDNAIPVRHYDPAEDDMEYVFENKADPPWVHSFPPLDPRTLGYNAFNGWRRKDFPVVEQVMPEGSEYSREWFAGKIGEVWRETEDFYLLGGMDMHLNSFTSNESAINLKLWGYHEYLGNVEPVIDGEFWTYGILSIYGPRTDDLRRSRWRLSVLLDHMWHGSIGPEGAYETRRVRSEPQGWQILEVQGDRFEICRHLEQMNL